MALITITLSIIMFANVQYFVFPAVCNIFWFYSRTHCIHQDKPISKSSLLEVAAVVLTEGCWSLCTGSHSRKMSEGESYSGTKRLDSCWENGGSESQPGGCQAQPLWRHVSQEAEESNTGIKQQ